MAIQGGVFLGVLTGVWYCHRHHLDTVHLMDVLAPAIILGQALGRCANLLNGDAFGAPTGSSFGIIYPTTTLAYRTYGDQPLWPAEVWEGQLDVVIFALLLLFRTTNHAKGQCFALYVMLYSLARFGLEFLRGDYTEKVLGLVTSAQATSITAFLIAAIGVLVLRITKPEVPRTFRCPFVWLIAPLAVLTCGYLMYHLPWETWVRFIVWCTFGCLVYFGYSYQHSALAHPHDGEED